MKITDKIKNIFSDKRVVFLNIRWAVAFACMFYLIFLKDTSTKTVFVEPDSNTQRIIILDHIINEVDKKDTIIQIMYDEIPNYSGASVDSLEREIARRYRHR